MRTRSDRKQQAAASLAGQTLTRGELYAYLETYYAEYFADDLALGYCEHHYVWQELCESARLSF